jgi:hypothetical protein
MTDFLERDELGQVLHEIDREWGHDRIRRRDELEKLRFKHMLAHIANKLAARPEYHNTSQELLREAAVQILGKAGADTSAPKHRKRTHDEEKIVSSGKLRWHKLLKAEGIMALRPWSRKSQNIPLRRSSDLLSSLSEPDVEPERGKTLLRDYVANQSLHLLNVSEQVKSINPQSLTPEVHHQLVQLYVACSKAGEASDREP